MYMYMYMHGYHLPYHQIHVHDTCTCTLAHLPHTGTSHYLVRYMYIQVLSNYNIPYDTLIECQEMYVMHTIQSVNVIQYRDTFAIKFFGSPPHVDFRVQRNRWWKWPFYRYQRVSSYVQKPARLSTPSGRSWVRRRSHDLHVGVVVPIQLSI